MPHAAWSVLGPRGDTVGYAAVVTGLAVHTLEHVGTDARHTYEAALLFSVLEPDRVKHRAVRELYVPGNA